MSLANTGSFTHLPLHASYPPCSHPTSNAGAHARPSPTRTLVPGTHASPPTRAPAPMRHRRVPTPIPFHVSQLVHAHPGSPCNTIARQPTSHTAPPMPAPGGAPVYASAHWTLHASAQDGPSRTYHVGAHPTPASSLCRHNTAYPPDTHRAPRQRRS
ncbi:hypothetical protein PLICRDRAFT_180849 [Plicaturopsis crispa FD-325 SS-3]|uniref:Uncharacterized protein n=1 Tax=Plicaturopsis crispa FD-325 SS-3 TaxID=944288 RepID=A0A0C9T4D5_PLICR|nr:hypothetical protein PLICRDRAFT_180849 [Plicaturopsis crispa FD-325 SS-3]